uniref:Serine incorporator n=1 Tax=Caenorhabditis tropicalis TaxID=1561998 RepID=A0A1I7TW59_9PELO
MFGFPPILLNISFQDSGIEVRPNGKRNRRQTRMQTSTRKKRISLIKEQLVDDNRQEDAKQNLENTIVIGLWLIVLYFTNLTFGLPFDIMWPARINHAAVALSYLLIGFWALCALHFFFRKRSSKMRWYKTYPKNYYFAWIVQLMGFALFCVATYPQIQRWSLLVSTFYFCFFATISNTFL